MMKCDSWRHLLQNQRFSFDFFGGRFSVYKGLITLLIILFISGDDKKSNICIIQSVYIEAIVF